MALTASVEQTGTKDVLPIHADIAGQPEERTTVMSRGGWPLSPPPRAPVQEPFVDAECAASFLCMRRKTLLELARRGKLPGHPVGSGQRRMWKFRIRARSLDVGSSKLNPAAGALFKENLLSRPRYQNGSLKLMSRKSSSSVWIYRWRETDEHGERQLRKQIIGTVKQYPTKALASSAIESLKLTINQQGFQRMAGPKTFSDLVDHYRSKELPEENHQRKTRKTKKNYEGNLKNHILPRWGSYQLRDIRSVDVEEWLDRVSLAPSSRAKLRNVMSTVYRHGIRWDWLGQHENPIAMVRVSSKRSRTPETLTVEEFLALLGKLPDRERAIGVLCATTGLRISEALGLKWGDIEFRTGKANVLRSVVDGAVGRCKTEISQQPVPLDDLVLAELQTWRTITMYASDTDWVFASGYAFGNMPIWAVSSLQRVLQPVAKRVGEDVRVVQELMRHAKINTTMEIYTHARMEKKRQAQSKVVDVLFGRERKMVNQ
jgi:integrase